MFFQKLRYIYNRLLGIDEEVVGVGVDDPVLVGQAVGGVGVDDPAVVGQAVGDVGVDDPAVVGVGVDDPAVVGQGVVVVNEVRLTDAGPTAVMRKSPVAFGLCVVATKTYMCPANRLTLI